ncbi:MAG: sugar phosphate isomerase/epimerase family protein [Halobacteriaceae archaeon]
MELVMFTKHLKRTGGLDLEAAADRMADWGFDGADLTVRPGGYVDPADVEAALPAAVDTLSERGLSVPMATTSVTGADEDHAEAVFRAAADCGIDRLKLGYWRYDGFGTLREGLAAMRADLDGLEELGAEHGVTPCVHVHSGDFLSANAAVLWSLLEDRDPDRLGAYLDPGHMAVEGGLSGWEQGLDLLADRARLLAVKDFAWRRAEGDREWGVETVPLEEGLVPWERAFDHLRESGYDGPVSLHSEYDWPFDDLAAQTGRDLEYVRELL